MEINFKIFINKLIRICDILSKSLKPYFRLYDSTKKCLKQTFVFVRGSKLFGALPSLATFILFLFNVYVIAELPYIYPMYSGIRTHGLFDKSPLP